MGKLLWWFCYRMSCYRITPRWLIRKYNAHVFRHLYNRYPAPIERAIGQALIQEFGVTERGAELAELSRRKLHQAMYGSGGQ